MQSEVYALAQKLGEMLTARGETVTTAESCTGGGVAQAITAVPGSSNYFQVAFVTYSNDFKHSLLGVAADTLRSKGAVSEDVAVQMARGALQKAGASYAVAISGIAGPDGGSEQKPIGTVWFAWFAKNGRPATQCCHFAGDRTAVREQAVVTALQGLLTLVDANTGPKAV